MRLLIDLQCAQSGSRTRGIGRYALSVLDALLPVAEAAGHEIHLLVNTAFPGTIPELQRRYPDVHAEQRIHAFHGLENSGLYHVSGPWRKAASGVLRDFAIAGLAVDAVFCPSIFEGESENFALRPLALSDTPSIGVQHDLIPLQMPEIYFGPNPEFAAFFHARLAEVPSYAALIAVSGATRNETLELLDFPGEHIHVVPEDAGAQFAPPDTMGLAEMDALRSRLNLPRPYLFYAGSGEPRKNLTGLVRAYAALPHGLRETHDLAIAGLLTKEEVAGIGRLAGELALDPSRIRLLGHVSEADLPGLYGLAALFVMPSFREGFGLPALEAIRCGTLVLGANATSLPEVIGTPQALFDPNDIAAMAALIERGLSDPGFRAETIAAQSAHAGRFSWERAARETLALLTRYACPARPAGGWPEVQARLDDLEAQAIAALRALPVPEAGPRARDWDDLARGMLHTRLAVEDAWRPHRLPETGDLSWRLEGPFDSSYSLASVNRETARALSRRGIEVALVSAEGPGPFDPDPDFLEAHPDLAKMHRAGQGRRSEASHVTSRNMFPPRVSDMRAPVNLLHGYAWEETGLPQSYTRDMTAHLQGLLVTAPHVKKLFEDAGIGLPVHVVGNGVDHFDLVPEPLPVALPEATFTVLHVSSCFPRKGADALLAAFADAFDGAEDVQLVIKTFPNPHNDIAEQIAALRAARTGLPPITVIEEELNPGQMHGLFVSADLLAAPSRAEGYCLPVAEAVLAGTPVLTTGWGGQTVFRGNPLVTFLDYAFAASESHLGAWDGVWAEPDHDDLVSKLRTARAAPPPDAGTRARAARLLRQDHGWDRVAERSEAALRNILTARPVPPPRVGWVSSYNTRCGIATYSAHLIGAFPDTVTVFASETEDRTDPDGPEVRRCWHQDGQDTLARMQAEIEAADPQVLVIQFNYGFFSFPHLAALIGQATAAGRRVVMMLHSTDDSAVSPERHLAGILPALAACDRLLVHSVHDMNRLKAMGLEENVALFPHGVPYAEVPPPPPMSPTRPVVLGTYGFFLPPKGLDKLIEAVALLRDRGEAVALQMINAEYPVSDSADAIATARARITELGLEEVVSLETGFLEDAESFAGLGAADLLVFPYRQTAESASGALRQALALERPVCATPLAIFDDVESQILRLPGTSAQVIADGLAPMIQALRDPASVPETAERLKTAMQNTARWRESHAYQTLGPRLWRQIRAISSGPQPGQMG